MTLRQIMIEESRALGFKDKAIRDAVAFADITVSSEQVDEHLPEEIVGFARAMIRTMIVATGVAVLSGEVDPNKELGKISMHGREN